MDVVLNGISALNSNPIGRESIADVVVPLLLLRDKESMEEVLETNESTE